jgi:hypothetical protein
VSKLAKALKILNNGSPKTEDCWCNGDVATPKRAALAELEAVVWFKSGSRSMRSLGWLSSSMANDFKGRSQ